MCFGNGALYRGEVRFAGPGCKQDASVLHDALGDPRNLRRRLSLGENDFGKPLSEFTMMIDLCKSQFLGNIAFQLSNNVVKRHLSIFELLKQFAESFFIHRG